MSMDYIFNWNLPRPLYASVMSLVVVMVAMPMILVVVLVPAEYD